MSWVAVLALAVVALLIAAVSWAAVRREKARLGFLHTTSLALLESRDLNAASVDVLRRASLRFGADCAELTLIPETGTATAFRTMVRGGEAVGVMRSTDLEDDEDGALTPPIFGVVHIAQATGDPWVARLCSRLGDFARPRGDASSRIPHRRLPGSGDAPVRVVASHPASIGISRSWRQSSP